MAFYKYLFFFLDALTKYCTDNLPQTRSKRVMNAMHDNTTLVPTAIPQEGREPGPPVVKRRCLPTQKSAPRDEILEEGPLDNGANEQEFPPSVEVDERHSNDIQESNSSNVQASSTSISKVRKRRGLTQMTAFQPPQGMKWTCMFIRGQPIGEPSSKLAGTLGLYARNEIGACLIKSSTSAGTRIAELIALEMSKQTKAPLEESRKKIWLVDSNLEFVDIIKSAAMIVFS
ncbi:hypothetical protein Taro_030526 [Colocasia esculenta]|uniref:Uncharacterized protein n=1 Tax=Colocasia esculenta TaxID=4460 RepID=A0A843VWD5_COLES|nr:hypothetical protein [Colocasia esculenta]